MTDTFEGEFIERADELDAAVLVGKTVDNAFYASIRKALLAAGGKLLVGPRGTGKTHQMRYVYEQCISDISKPAAVYCSFSRYVRLEPLLKQTSEALLLFNSWVVAKIAIAACDFLIATGHEKGLAHSLLAGHFQQDHEDMVDYVSIVESRGMPSAVGISERLTVDSLNSWMVAVLQSTGRTRLILLLDDAALSMTPEYLVEFFNIFQDLKTEHVSPKASVYPGTSQYGPRFHLRHDVQAINAWLSIEDPQYNETMNQLLDAWDHQAAALPDGVIDLLKYAAFGVPRVLLSMVRTYKETQWSTAQQGVNFVIEQQVELMSAEYESLAVKVPQFATVIAAGDILFKNIVEFVAERNRDPSTPNDGKHLLIGIPAKDVSVLHGRMLRFLVEVGFMYPMTSVKHGEDRTYLRFIPHIAPLIKARAFQLGSGFSARSQVQFIERERKLQLLRVSVEKLTEGAVLKLDLAKCSKCGTSRLTESQKFCHVCGAELTHKSLFEECMALSVEKLPITRRQKVALQEEKFATIGDIIATQNPTLEIRSPGLIGRKRSMEIVTKAQRYVDDYFS